MPALPSSNGHRSNGVNITGDWAPVVPLGVHNLADRRNLFVASHVGNPFIRINGSIAEFRRAVSEYGGTRQLKSTLIDPLGEAERVEVVTVFDQVDRIGPDQFLRKYGFEPARTYELVVGDQRYDSKAIFGVAYGIVNPSIGILLPHEPSRDLLSSVHRVDASGAWAVDLDRFHVEPSA